MEGAEGDRTCKHRPPTHFSLHLKGQLISLSLETSHFTLMVKSTGILDKSLSKGKSEVSLSTFALLFSEVVKYAQERSETVADIHDRLASYGKIVGIRMLDVINFREKGYRRETKLLGMLMFIKSFVWKNLFGKEADKLERSNDDQCTYLIIEKEPIVNTFISVPKDKGMLNCAAFVAGIIQAMLEFQAQCIATVNEKLHRHLFRSDVPSTSTADFSINIELPKLKSPSLQEHFRIVAQEMVYKYKILLDSAASFPMSFPKPPLWKCQSGWTKYSHNGTIEKVEYPQEDVFFFDVETCVKDGQLPTLAVALSGDAWYCWCSDRLVFGTAVPSVTRLHHMIPLGGLDEARVVIGHNVGYDRARARESYEKKKSPVRFMDTMSMAIPMFGMADHQVVKYESDDSDFTVRVRTLFFDIRKQVLFRNSVFSTKNLYLFRTISKKKQ
ncbi:transport protein particle component, Bet3 [Dictyocaulus viviparus]|uniref:Transport protein particle component, Bet3 n=1 Tax=Dictyocaulus viviparus TaxID=29172 RepID=A0A0D8Y0Y4_DICVI|nr:transport protein particle component, Bet3 [Dictyocaulus viviparus]